MQFKVTKRKILIEFLAEIFRKNHTSGSWDRSYDSKNIFALNFAKKLAFFAQNIASLCMQKV
jgi:hypothetical protein